MKDSLVHTDCRLIAPTSEYRDSYLAMLREHQAQGRFLDSRHVDNDVARIGRAFDAFVAKLEAAAIPEQLRPGHVPEYFFWLIAGGEVVARSTLRLALSDAPALRDLGHIGYDTKPSAWGRGYGSMAMTLTLERARSFGLEKVLLTCNSDNLASKRIIEAHGGVLERAVPIPGRPYTRLRYWVAAT